MKQEQHKFNPGHVVPWGSTGGYMIRRGERGGADELLTREQRQRIDGACRAQLVALGSDFPYDEMFGAPGCERERRHGTAQHGARD